MFQQLQEYQCQSTDDRDDTSHSDAVNRLQPASTEFNRLLPVGHIHRLSVLFSVCQAAVSFIANEASIIVFIAADHLSLVHNKQSVAVNYQPQCSLCSDTVSSTAGRTKACKNVAATFSKKVDEDIVRPVITRGQLNKNQNCET